MLPRPIQQGRRTVLAQVRGALVCVRRPYLRPPTARFAHTPRGCMGSGPQAPGRLLSEPLDPEDVFAHCYLEIEAEWQTLSPLARLICFSAVAASAPNSSIRSGAIAWTS